MWYLLLDESGDLGFDFVNKKPSRFFTICILAISGAEAFYAVRAAVKKTLRRKVNRGGRAKTLSPELKATETTLGTKRYFFDLVKGIKFGLYAVTLNKRKVYERLTHEKERVYNYIARLVLDKIPFEKADDCVQLYVDKSKGKTEIRDFNGYIVRQLQGRLEPKTSLHIDHLDSEAEPALQAVDMFVWGVFRKYERDDKNWFSCFADKILFDGTFLE